VIGLDSSYSLLACRGRPGDRAAGEISSQVMDEVESLIHGSGFRLFVEI